MDKKILVIIPCYNEEDNIVNTVENLRATCPEVDFLVVNDCSTDSSAALLKSRHYPFLDLPVNLGIGGGVQCGYLYAVRHGYDVAVQMDGDGQHDPAYLMEVVQPVLDGVYDMCIGSRFIKKEGFQTSFMRRVGIRWLSGMIRLLCGKRVLDVTSGFRKAAGIPGRLRLFCQRLGDHTARHMVDGRRAQRLVQPRLCHAAHTVPAVNRNDAGGIGQQRDLRHHRQTGRGIYVIAAVLDDGAFSPLRRQAAALRGNLHNKTFGCTQPDCLGRTAGQQQPCRPRRTQRRAGAGGVAAPQQLLPAADVMFKFWLGIVFSVQGRILLRCQIKQAADVILGKGSLG